MRLNKMNNNRTFGSGSKTVSGDNALVSALTGLTANTIVIANGSSTVVSLPPGASGQFLESQGPGVDPIWGVPSGGISGLTSGKFAIATSGTTIGNSFADFSLGLYHFKAAAGLPPQFNIQPDATTVGSGDGANLLLNNNTGGQISFAIDAPGIYNFQNGQAVFRVSGTSTDYFWYTGATQTAHLDAVGNFTSTNLTPTNPLGFTYLPLNLQTLVAGLV